MDPMAAPGTAARGMHRQPKRQQHHEYGGGGRLLLGRAMHQFFVTPQPA